MKEIGYALAAIIISLLSFISTQISLRRTVDGLYVKSLEDRMKDAELRLVACTAEGVRLNLQLASVRDENVYLMRKILEAQRNGGHINIDEAAPLVRRARQGAELDEAKE